MSNLKTTHEDIEIMAKQSGLITRMKKEVDLTITLNKQQKLEAVIKLLVILNDGVD